VAKLLTIETGFTCNSRCHYCTQLDYRALPQTELLDLPTAAIQERIAWAAKNGYDQIGFSGGEPTIRPDFLDLVRFAQEHDFERIGVTTNGRMFAYRAFALEAMRCGLDGFTFSLHGHTPALHDGITHAQGSLDQALEGLHNIAWASEKLGVRAHLMNNQILLPENTPHIRDVVAMLGPLGVKLFMIQPFISQRSNIDDLQRFFVPYEDVVAAVGAAEAELRRWNARVKPYNVPNCILWRFGKDVVEPQFYGITVFREFEQETAGEFKAFKARQWYRIDDCKTCKEVCPGFRIEQYPQAKMQADVVAAAANFDSPERDGALLIGGTELLERATLAATLRQVAAERGPVAWLTSLCERVPRAELADVVAELAEEGALAELVLVAQPLDQRFLAQRVLEKGNLEELRQGLYHLAEQRERGRRLPKLRLLVNVGDLLRLLEDDLVKHQWPLLVNALKAAAGDPGIDVQVSPACRSVDAIRTPADDRVAWAWPRQRQITDVLLAVPNFPRDVEPPDMARQHEDNRRLALKLQGMCDNAGLRPLLVTLGDKRGLDAARAAAMALAEAQFGAVLAVESWAARLFRHPLCSPEMDFVSWFPPWLFERWDLSRQAVAEPGRKAGTAAGVPAAGVRRAAVATLAGKAALQSPRKGRQPRAVGVERLR
jgi:MoaA/NifB/PqqE/SkfB family radical SAM enzyme